MDTKTAPPDKLHEFFALVDTLDETACIKYIDTNTDFYNKQGDVKNPYGDMHHSITPLMYTCMRGLINVVKKLIPVSDINLQDKNGYTALMNTIVYTNKTALIITQLLIDAKTDVNIRDISGDTALTKAIYCGEPDIAMKLLDYIDIHATNNSGETPLYQACQYDNKILAIELIKRGATVDIQHSESKRSILHYACINRMVTVVDLLLEKKCDITLRDKMGDTALMHIGNRYVTSDHISLQIVDKLLKAGIDINAQNEEGTTALISYIYYYTEDIAIALVKYGADIHIKANGKTAFTDACDTHCMRLLPLLLEQKCDVNIVDKDGRTPLMNACKANSREIALLLVDIKCDANVRDKFGLTALSYALNNKMFGVINKLMPCTDLNKVIDSAHSDGETYLMRACKYRMDDIALSLIIHKADVNIVNVKKTTALMTACDFELSIVVDKLIESNANINVLDKHNRSAFGAACLTKNDGIIIKLIDSGADYMRELYRLKYLDTYKVHVHIFGKYRKLLRDIVYTVDDNTVYNAFKRADPGSIMDIVAEYVIEGPTFADKLPIRKLKS
ncbi:MAG: hypothetical protein Faunusvirus18_7 [Faunusvirus sp.]|jgi:ankyrin repeat protein|uniref:Uncharacterized protein n=1 Tax=Faunusvirus sp. TaxID=2487766 RepID=A0A3G4ZX68_9VIRU|nr:MAG: hypothetical protein Faunusvirus18_7 [Faunusvirus sp.]